MKRCNDCYYHRAICSNTAAKHCMYALETKKVRGGWPEDCTVFKPRCRGNTTPVYTLQDGLYEDICEAPLLSVGRYGRNRMGITEEY